MEFGVNILVLVLVYAGVVDRVALVVHDHTRAADRQHAAADLDYPGRLEV